MGLNPKYPVKRNFLREDSPLLRMNVNKIFMAQKKSD